MKIYTEKFDNVTVFYTDTSEVYLDRLLPMLSSYRIEKINKIKKESDKLLSASAEYLLLYGLNELGYNVKKPLEFTENAYGKPELATNPGIHFNMSHAGNVAMCVISTSNVGIDVEKSDRESKAISEKYFTQNEKKLMDDKGFCYIWTRKEAALKAQGTGISAGLNTIDVCDDRILINKSYYSLTSFVPKINGYSAAVCAEWAFADIR